MQVLPSPVCVAGYVTVVLTLLLLHALATSPELPQLPALGRVLNSSLLPGILSTVWKNALGDLVGAE